MCNTSINVTAAQLFVIHEVGFQGRERKSMYLGSVSSTTKNSGLPNRGSDPHKPWEGNSQNFIKALAHDDA